jgi:hypothetical protein
MKTELDLDPGLNPNPDPTLITDSNRDPNLQIIPVLRIRIRIIFQDPDQFPRMSRIRIRKLL